jgi:hypothetical protein
VIENEGGKYRNLKIRLQNPYGQIKSSKVTPILYNIYNKDNKIWPNQTKNDTAIFNTLSYNQTYTVIVPKTIDIAPHKIQANFSAWSDSQKYHVNNRNGTIQRNVALNSNLELLALYKIQYSLKAINVDDNSNVT